MTKGVALSGVRMTAARQEALAKNPDLSPDELAQIRKSVSAAFPKFYPAETKVESKEPDTLRRIHMTQLRKEALERNPNLTNEELLAIRKVSTPAPYAHIVQTPVHDVIETDAHIEARLRDRISTISELSKACINGDARSLIVSGPAGFGKTYEIEKQIKATSISPDNYTIVKGYMRATGLFKLLYKMRHEGNVLVIDDNDNIFNDEVALNLLKAVCDTTEHRRVSWNTETMFVDDETGEPIPKTFDFNGSVIFITNYDFDRIIAHDKKMANHLNALISRSHYIDCGLKSNRDCLVRIKMAVKEGMLSDLTPTEKTNVMAYIEKRRDNLRELSLRMALKIGTLCKTMANWERFADVTACRNMAH